MVWYPELYRLQFIIRYSNIPRLRDENVAQHSFFVSSICLELMEEYDYSWDRGSILTMAISHDWSEAEVDDVAHNIKRDYPSIRNSLKDAEKKVMSKYPINISKAFLEYEGGSTPEAVSVKLADTIQCIQYLETEVNLGNRYMEPLLAESRDYVISIKSRLLSLIQSS